MVEKIIFSLKQNSFFLEEADRRKKNILGGQFYKVFGYEQIRLKDLKSNKIIKNNLLKSRLGLINDLKENINNEIQEIKNQIKNL
jgi:hypothetical protein